MKNKVTKEEIEQLRKIALDTIDLGIHQIMMQPNFGKTVNIISENRSKLERLFSLILDVPKSEQWLFKEAVAAVSSGSHQIERDCDNIELLKEVLKEVFPNDNSVEDLQGVFKFYFNSNGKNGFDYDCSDDINESKMYTLKLSEIQPKEVKAPLAEVLNRAMDICQKIHELKKVVPEYAKGSGDKPEIVIDKNGNERIFSEKRESEVLFSIKDMWDFSNYANAKKKGNPSDINLIYDWMELKNKFFGTKQKLLQLFPKLSTETVEEISNRILNDGKD